MRSMENAEIIAKRIVKEKTDLYEEAIEHNIDPLYLQLEVARLTGNKAEAASVWQRIEQKKKDEAELNAELARLRRSLKQT